jgi:long-subunit acyl-CoA synthetase (AMP-forming)
VGLVTVIWAVRLLRSMYWSDALRPARSVSPPEFALVWHKGAWRLPGADVEGVTERLSEEQQFDPPWWFGVGASVLISIGLAGTFLGLTMGLMDAVPKLLEGKHDEAVNELLAGAQLAFLKSLAGIVLGTLWTLRMGELRALGRRAQAHLRQRLTETFPPLTPEQLLADGLQAQLQGQAPQASLPLKLLRALAFGHIRVFLGLQNVKSALTGAAPVPPELVRWFMDCGIELREAFGMTETCGFCTATPAGGVRLGWAGLPAPHTELKIGPQDEIWVRGDNVFGGYWGQPERTREAIDADGWLHTGDCGEIGEHGYLAVRDRIKDILITSAGKNITPSQIESQLKFSPFITDAVVIGDGRHYLTCLIMIDQEHVARFAQDQQVPYTDFASLTRAPEVLALLQAELEKVNAQLARVEQIKHFRLIDQLLTAEDEELTPTMKLKRKVVASKYAHLISQMYASP